jgi:putative membrane protein
VALDGLPTSVGVAAFAAVFLTSFVVARLIKLIDHESIVSPRRMFGLTMAAVVLWALPTIIGSAVSWIGHAHQAGLNEFIVGWFLAWSFELLVINGAFVSSTVKSLVVAAVQPGATVLLVLSSVRAGTPQIYAALFGLVTLAMVVAFMLRFKRFKTAGAGIDSLQTFQSFLKSWVSHNPADLEGYFSKYSHEEPVATRIVVATGSNQVALVLPGVHPGPFYPVGSYNVSELIFRELRQNGITSVVLHGAGGHERNLPTNELTKRYAASVASSTKEVWQAPKFERIRGPRKLQLGHSTVTTMGFGNNVIAFLSNAPYNTDDLEPRVFDEALSAAKDVGVELLLVDAHNSIGGANCDAPRLDWKAIVSDNKGAPEEDFQVGVAHSSELQLHHGSDISEGGVTVLVFKQRNSTYALVTSDSNNAIVGLRQSIADALRKAGAELIELCTSDTHNSAARQRTDRGYNALGEESDREMLISTIEKLEKMAEARVSRGSVATISSQVTLPLIGDKSINDFAALTKDAIDFTKAYAAGAFVVTIVLCGAALLV